MAHFAFNAPNVRQVRGVAKKLGFDEQTQVNDVLHASVGDTGCAASLLSLVAALERSEGGETILLACYGNGCDTAVLETTDRVASVPPCRGVRRHIESRRELRNYEQYLRWRQLLPIQPAARPPIEERMPSPAAQWREVPWEMRLTGTRCMRCGTPQYPPQRVCVTCHTKDEMEPYRFTDVPAKVFSFSHDYVMETLDTPVTVTFIDFEGGGRVMCDMTDRDAGRGRRRHARGDVVPPALLRERRLQLLVEVPAGQMPAARDGGLTVESIKDRVAIVGMGCVKFGENWGQSLEDMIVDAAYEAFEDAGIGPEDIQAAWWGTVFAGHTGQILATPLKLAYIPVTHVENACATGSEAIRNACYAVAAGMYDIVLAVGAEKLKDTATRGCRRRALWPPGATGSPPRRRPPASR